MRSESRSARLRSRLVRHETGILMALGLLIAAFFLGDWANGL